MEIPYEVTPRRDTGLYNSKLGVWLFLASEVMLFGGLFSAYIFLRVDVQTGVDNPWPWGLNVHKGYVWLGFINTLVLIASSVGVVFAWVALKERKWRTFQVWMFGVVGCAVVFMCLKSVEYNSKLNKHHGIKLVDGSVMEGVILDGSDAVRFEANKLTLNLQAGMPWFVKDLEKGTFPKLTVEGSEGPVTIESAREFRIWFNKSKREVSRQLISERKRYRSEKAAGVQNPAGVNVSSSAVLVSAEPFRLNGNPRKIAVHTDSAINYRDGLRVDGKLISDDVKFVVHEVDMQLVLPQQQKDSVVWEVIGDESAKRSFFEQQQVAYEQARNYYEKRGQVIPEKMRRGYQLNLHKVHVHGSSHEAGETGGARGDAIAADDHSGDHPITVPRDQIQFMGNHGPRYGNYYAIYFTMTALHGLHVIGGALVLLFFAVFGKKIYDKDPEHLANRVEVGGLFWHFVDLIWIFLFPVMYLL